MRGGWKRAAVVLLAAVLVAGACGGGDDGDENEAAGPGGAEQPEVEEEFEIPAVVDRSTRFAGEDTSCEPAAEEPEEAPEAIDGGITAEEIVITHVRVTLEDLADIGFAVDIGDTADQAETFVKIINERCGGIHGRMLQLETVEYPALPDDVDAVAQRECIRIAEDQQAVVAYSLTGAGGPLVGCLTGANEVLFLTTYAITDSEIAQADGRLFSVSTAPSDIMRYAVTELAPELEGKRIGVVYPDSPGDPQIVQEGLLASLEQAGHDVVRADVLGCDGPTCRGNLAQSVQGMIADDVDVIFPILNTISLPIYLAEMVTQGVQPGDFEFLNLANFAQDGELVSGKVVEFGGEDAGKLYDGTLIISATRAGQQREPGYEPDPFLVMCNREYAETSDVIDEPYDWADDTESNKYGATSGQCAGLRMVARAIEAAGPNPSRADIAEAMADLGGVDLGGNRTGSFRPGKTTAPDQLVRIRFRYPCPQPAQTRGGNCMVPESDYKPFPDVER